MVEYGERWAEGDKKKKQCLHPQGGEKQDIAFPQTDWAFRHERPMLIAMQGDAGCIELYTAPA